MKLFGNPEQLPKMVTCKEFLQAEICTVSSCVLQGLYLLFLCKNTLIILGNFIKTERYADYFVFLHRENRQVFDNRSYRQ